MEGRAHTAVTGASPEDRAPFFVCLSTSVGSSTAHLLPNRDERVGMAQREREMRLSSRQEGYGCGPPPITSVIDDIRPSVSRHLAALYKTAASVL